MKENTGVMIGLGMAIAVLLVRVVSRLLASINVLYMRTRNMLFTQSIMVKEHSSMAKRNMTKNSVGREISNRQLKSNIH